MTCLAFNASIEEEKDKSWLKVRSKNFHRKDYKSIRLDLISIKLYFMLPIDLINIIEDGIIETITTIQIKKLDGAVTIL